MKKYKQLTSGLRYQIYELKQAGLNQTEIIKKAVQVQWINHRSRKVLGFRTSHEVFFGVILRYTKQPLAVALRP